MLGSMWILQRAKQEKRDETVRIDVFASQKFRLTIFQVQPGAGGNFRSLMDQINLNESDVGSDDLISASI